MRNTTYVIFGFSCLITLCWPLIVLPTFMTAAAPGTMIQRIANLIWSLALLGYPYGTLIAVLEVFGKKKDEELNYRKTILYSLLPFAQIGILFLAAIAVEKSL